jgi:hypothetical protein
MRALSAPPKWIVLSYLISSVVVTVAWLAGLTWAAILLVELALSWSPAS